MKGGVTAPTTLVKRRLGKTVKKERRPAVGSLTAGVEELGRLLSPCGRVRS